MSLADGPYLGLKWFLWALSLVIFVTRVGVLKWKRLPIYWISEACLGLAIILSLAQVVADQYAVPRGIDEDFDNYYPRYTQWLYVSFILFDTNVYFPRFSLLIFYYHLFPITEERLRMCLNIVIAYNIAGFFNTLFIDTFWCGTDVSVNWAEYPECSLITAWTPLYVNWPINLMAELQVFILPFGMLPTLRALPRSDKIALTCLFLMGSITIVSSITRFILNVKSQLGNTTFILGSVEISVQIMIASLPGLRPLLRLVGSMFSQGWNKMTSSNSSSRKPSSSSGGLDISNFSFQEHNTLDVEKITGLNNPPSGGAAT